LSYKENTNSVKNSPAVTFLNAFKGFEISVYDPVVSDEIVPFAKHHTSMYSCLTGVDVLVILTAWNEFKSLTLSCLTGSMRGRSVIDPFGCLEHLNLSDGGFDYFRIGQSK
jgi:UDPglucose 6-dehydrogenase